MADTIREYLVALGFDVNEAKLHRFQDAIAGTARSAAGLGAEVVGVGFALTEMVERVARHFEDLYYMSQRTGATVSGLDAIGFAAKQVGLSAEEARGSVEGMAHAIRLNPGTRALAQAMGVSNPQELAAHYKRQYGEGGYFIAARQAEQLFAVSEKVFQHYWMFGDKLKEAELDHLKRMREAGLDADVEAEKFIELGRVINKLADDFSITGMRIAEDWRKPVQGMLGELDGLIQQFNRLDKSTEGYLGKVTGLIAAIGGVEVLGKLVARAFGIAVPSIAATIPAVAGGAVAWDVIGELEKKNETGRPPDWDAIAQLPWWQRMAIGFQKTLGADPNQFLPGGTHGPARPPVGLGGSGLPSLPRPRPPVGSSSKVWGDDEAVAAGLYESNIPLPRSRPSGDATFHINQTNNIDGAASPAATAAEIKNAHRELGDVLRNMYQKVQ